jgi:hypothetical protein
VARIFRPETLGKFEDASASIPLRQLDRAFARVGIFLGKDPAGSDGTGGTRRTQFRRYVAGVDQQDPQQLARLGEALGALVDEAATSKQEFLVHAAERDGFVFANGTFRLPSGPRSFAVAHVEDFALIDEHGRRLRVLAESSPTEAVVGAVALVESVSRTVLHGLSEPAPAKKANLADVVKRTLKALELAAGKNDPKSAALTRKCLEQLTAVVATVGELRDAYASGHGRGVKAKDLLPHHARLAAGAAVTIAAFIAGAFAERVAIEKRLMR